jgi:hypothetical protein
MSIIILINHSHQLEGATKIFLLKIQVMSKWILTLGIIIALHSPKASNAQVFAGLKGGIGITTLNNVGNEKPSGYRYKPGLSFPYAAFCDIRLSDHFVIQAEFGHALMGGQKSGIYPLQQEAIYGSEHNVKYTDCPGETRLYYLTSAVLAKYNYPISSVCNAYIGVGVAPQFLLKAEEVSIGNGNLYASADETSVIIASKYIAETTNNTSNYHSWNWSLAGAAGLRWQMYQEYVFIELIARRGLQSVELETEQYRHTTTLYALSVGYGFHL